MATCPGAPGTLGRAQNSRKNIAVERTQRRARKQFQPWLYMLDDYGKKTAPQFSYPLNGDFTSPRITGMRRWLWRCSVSCAIPPLHPHED